MKNTLKMSLFMPPISPVKDAATGKNVKSATLTPLRTMNLEEVYKLITSNEHLATLTLAVRNAALRGNRLPMPKAANTALRHSLRRIHPTTERLPHGILRPGCSRYRPP
jgi:nitrate reductase beta subunit